MVLEPFLGAAFYAIKRSLLVFTVVRFSDWPFFPRAESTTHTPYLHSLPPSRACIKSAERIRVVSTIVVGLCAEERYRSARFGSSINRQLPRHQRREADPPGSMKSRASIQLNPPLSLAVGRSRNGSPIVVAHILRRKVFLEPTTISTTFD